MSEKYLGEISTPLLINQIKENCTQKRSTLPIASIDELGNTYQYTGTTSGSLVHGYFYECVSDGQDPATYSWVALIDFGTAALKNSTDRVSPNNTALVESQSVYSAINTALSSIYTPRGDITCAELTSSLLISDNIGNVYETSDSGTTTALFLQGAGHPIAVGSNVGIINAGQGRILFNLMANAFDLTGYQKKDLTSAIEGETTVEGALGALSTNKQAKTLTTSVESQTTVEGALGALSINKATQAEVNDIVNVLGAKNLFPNEAVSATSSGITFTVNSDGTVSVSGTATNNAYLIFPKISLKKGTYIISGCPDINQSETKAFLYVNSLSTFDYGSGAEFTLSSDNDNIDVAIRVNTGVSFSSAITFKPMIRLASIADDTYEPYSMTNQELTPIAQAVSNRNLLDNPWFTVNQRGFTSANTVGYTVDRWQLSWNPGNITVSLGNNGITLDATNAAGLGYFAQFIDNLDIAGKVVTASVLLADGTIKTGTGVMPTKGSTSPYIITGEFNLYLQYNSNNDTPRLYISIGEGHSVTIRAVKLELGSVSTLAQDTAPNYQQELAKCQRYFQRIKTSNAGSPYGFGFTFSPTDHRITIPSIKGLRTNPSITGDVSKWVIRTADGTHQGTPTAVALSNYDSDNGVMIAFTTNDFGSTTSEMVIATCGYADGYLDFSADL